jgi:hypothetical protein
VGPRRRLPCTSGDRSGGGEGGGSGAQRWVAEGGSRLRTCRPERSDARASGKLIVSLLFKKRGLLPRELLISARSLGATDPLPSFLYIQLIHTIFYF